jgi:NAD(P)-dependent dehydrogenase (short-subunit alcohol dehydrogenase family)
MAAQRGYAVCINYLERHADADAVVESIRKAGGDAIAVRADISLEHDVMRMFETVDRELGHPPRW